LVHLVVKNFHIRISAFADLKNIPMVQETRRKQKSTNVAKDGIWFPVVVPKTDTGELNVSPGSAIVEA
jgi:hypothetical protein